MRCRQASSRHPTACAATRARAARSGTASRRSCKTFVAHLEANWAEEPTTGGTVLTECLKNLSAPYTPGSDGGRGE
jgi:hypothetical protein